MTVWDRLCAACRRLWCAVVARFDKPEGPEGDF